MKNILWASKTGDANAWYHIEPFRNSHCVANLYVVRHKLPNRVSAGVDYYTFNHDSMIKECIGYTRKSISIIREKNIDVIVTFNPFPWGIISYLLSRFFGIPIVFGLIGGELDPTRTNFIYRKFLQFILRRCEVVTVTGQNYMSELNKLGLNTNVFVFPHLVDYDYLCSSDASNLKCDMVTVTSFREVKRSRDVINALKILIDRGINLSLTMVGDGPEREKCLELVNDLGLVDNVIFTGYVDDIRPFLKNSKYYIQTSSSEGLSLALLESFALGNIPILTNAGDEKDIIEDKKTGFFVDIANPAQIADAIEFLESSPELAQNVRRNIHEALLKIDIKSSQDSVDLILDKA